MKTIDGLLCLLLALGLSGCGGEADVNAFKSTIGMSKVQVESQFGEPESSVLESTADHPGGYWIYKVKSGGSCKLRFDLPPRVLGVDC